MSYATIQVELDNGHVRATNSEPLPAKAKALLVLLPEEPAPDSAAELSAFDLMKDGCGIVRSGVPDLATNPKHMEGFGR